MASHWRPENAFSGSYNGMKPAREPEAIGNPWDRWLGKWFYFLLTAGVFVNVLGLFTPILEPDGALYAMIAKTMVQSGDYINLRVEDQDWLDKPHFPFWMAALGYKIFGIGTAGYKIPALIFWALGGVYTYLLGQALYSRNVGKVAVLIYLTAAHLVVSNNDVRAEPYLTGLIAGSVFHFYKASTKGFGIHLVAGALLCGLAAMTKGPFVLLVIGSGFIIHWLLHKEWNQFLHYRWWFALLMIALFILPEIYCLYMQFDRHPEKLVFGRRGVSGIRFFFWESQFGRFMNTGPIKGKGDVFFYLHTVAWAFLPWSILFFAALIRGIGSIRIGQSAPKEFITFGASLVTFILFSMSRFQLPHYMNIVFPFFSVITAQFLLQISRRRAVRLWGAIQYLISFVLIIAAIGLAVFYRVPGFYVVGGLMLVMFGSMLYVFRKSLPVFMLGRTFVTAVVVYAFLNLSFYPAVLKYQAGTRAAYFVNDLKPAGAVSLFLPNSYSFPFYLDKPVEYFYSVNQLKERASRQTVIVYTGRTNVAALTGAGLKVDILKSFQHFHISRLTGRFLFYKTRNAATSEMVVARVGR